MLRLFPTPAATCEGCTRRAMVQVGGASVLGLVWPHLLKAQVRPSGRGARPRANACVIIFLFGGPGQQDLWDLKPNAPDGVRGEFRPVATRIPGLQISDQLPCLARQADRFTLVRSVTHTDFEHGSASYTALTGQPHPLPGTNTPARPEDFPTYAAVVSKLRPARKPVPDTVVVGPVMHQGNRPPLAGQSAGFLGHSLGPFRIAENPAEAGFRVEGLQSLDQVSLARQGARQELVRLLDTQARRWEGKSNEWDGIYQRAFELLRSERTRQALDLGAEKPAVRDRYGRSRFGQSLLLTRRLLEAGVPFVTVNWARQNGDQWDTHKANYPRLRQLLPPFDRGLATFVEDLHERGLLDTTLVYCLGEFGRTPRINKDAGRDHWPACYSVLLAGGGIRPGRIVGASDRLAAAVTEQPTAPWDLAATVYHALGIDPQAHLFDPLGRPLAVSSGSVVANLL